MSLAAPEQPELEYSLIHTFPAAQVVVDNPAVAVFPELVVVVVVEAEPEDNEHVSAILPPQSVTLQAVP